MSSQKCLAYAALALLSLFSLILGTARAWAASSEKVLLSFDADDGNYPQADLIFDSAGNLYGTVARGTLHGNGGVFELIPDGKDNWTEKVLYSFHGKDGSYPASRLVFDKAGNLYGTTQLGGSSHGCGAVFKLTPRPEGRWNETILHSFNGRNGEYGCTPNGVTLDEKGGLYGTTLFGGDANDDGLVFKLSNGKDGKWTETVLLAFDFEDGSTPTGTLILDKSGSLYGTTAGGGSINGGCGCGLIFQLVPGSEGQWDENILYRFGSYNGDGQYPEAGLIRDAAGSFYGTTAAGGTGGGAGYGTAFKLDAGTWAETVLYSFQDNDDGAEPYSDLARDESGNLYGTAPVDKFSHRTPGLVFELSPSGQKGGSWTEKVLHVFDGKDGSQPLAGVVLEKSGKLYGTTRIGGTYRCHTHGCGTIYEVTP